MRTAIGCHQILLARVCKAGHSRVSERASYDENPSWLDGGRLDSPSCQADGAASRDSGGVWES